MKGEIIAADKLSDCIEYMTEPASGRVTVANATEARQMIEVCAALEVTWKIAVVIDYGKDQPIPEEKPVDKAEKTYVHWQQPGGQATYVRKEWIVPLTSGGLPVMPKQVTKAIKGNQTEFVKKEVEHLTVRQVKNITDEDKYRAICRKPAMTLDVLTAKINKDIEIVWVKRVA